MMIFTFAFPRAPRRGDVSNTSSTPPSQRDARQRNLWPLGLLLALGLVLALLVSARPR